MDEKQKAEAQVEDLDVTDAQADDVKGGFHWGVSQSAFGDGSVRTVKIDVQSAEGMNLGNHNETLIRI